MVTTKQKPTAENLGQFLQLPKSAMNTTYTTMTSWENQPWPALPLERYDDTRISSTKGSANYYYIWNMLHAQSNKTISFVYFSTAQNGVGVSCSVYFTYYT